MTAGRPTVVTPGILAKLEEAFLMGCTDLEACFFADISKTALYDYQNRHPEFTERKEALKERPVLLARKAVINSFDEDSNLAFNYLKNKRSDEFSEKKQTELSGSLSLTDALALADEPSTEERGDT